MTIRRIIYQSSAAQPMDDDGLLEILEQAQARNAALGLSGILLYGAESFMQVLEGPGDAVAEVYDSIAADPRHADLVKIEDAAGVERLFGDWSMAFVREESFGEEDRAGFRALRETVLAEAGMNRGDPGIVAFLTRAFLNAVAAMRSA